MQETIKCEKCGKEVIKRSVNHTLCMDCVYKEHVKSVKKLYDLDMRNMGILSTKDNDE